MQYKMTRPRRKFSLTVAPERHPVMLAVVSKTKALILSKIPHSLRLA